MRPAVGVAVIVKKDGKILLGKRKGSHGEGDWAFPGGHLELNESIETCIERELSEEVGITVKNIQKYHFTNDIFENEGKHYITLFMTADYDSGEVCLLEPEKCERWDWFDWNSLPQNLFLPIQNLKKENYLKFVNLFCNL